MYCVFQTAPGRLDSLAPLLSENVKVVNVGHCQSQQDIISALAMHGWQKQVYYLSQARTAEDAIKEAAYEGYEC
jgi:hypothetical protein